jgi:hypothetical protein
MGLCFRKLIIVEYTTINTSIHDAVFYMEFVTKNFHFCNQATFYWILKQLPTRYQWQTLYIKKIVITLCFKAYRQHVVLMSDIVIVLILFFRLLRLSGEITESTVMLRETSVEVCFAFGLVMDSRMCLM